MTRSIALLGSTGSIGRQTLEVARELGLSVAALTANKSVELIEQQAREFCPRLAVLYDEDAARELRARLSDTNTQVLSGMEVVDAICQVKTDRNDRPETEQKMKSVRVDTKGETYPEPKKLKDPYGRF